MFPRLLTLTLLTALLAGCGSGRRAPVVDLSFDAAAPAPVAAPQTTLVAPVTVTPPTVPAAATTYRVQPGDTLYSIARSTGASLDALIRANDIGDPDRLLVGQELRLSTDGSAPIPPIASSTEPPADPAPERAAADAGRVANTDTPAAPSRRPPPQRAADASLNTWGWPASGAVIQAFTPATKGIDLAGNSGDPVTAAADGKVMYVGNGVRGLGNLILVEHAGGFLSAYAHNNRTFVSKDQSVKRGAKIAEVGQTDTSSPRLHFEVRRQGTPVNPLLYLPPR